MTPGTDRVLLFLLMLLLQATVACTQITPTEKDDTRFDHLDDPEFPMDIGPYGSGSGEGEEPPGYDGEWWGVNDGEFDGHHFHTGDDLREVAKEVVALHISSMNGGAMPNAIGSMRNLRSLEIEYSNPGPLPNGIWSLPKLESLRISVWSEAGIDVISPKIAGLKALKRLGISGTSDVVLRIPAELAMLPLLEELSISGVNLPRFPKAICNLRNLKALFIIGCELTELPEAIDQLQLLDTLDLSENALQELPAAISNLSHLRWLDLHLNALKTLPDQFGNMTSLTRLELSQNALQRLPGTIGQLQALQELEVEDNALIALPDAIGQLQNLTTLNLHHNRLQFLPSTIGGLSSLKTCFLALNQLTTLPSSIGELQQLEILGLTENPLNDLPAEITALRSLRHMGVNKTGLLDLPKETWDFINRFGPKIRQVPKEIEGKPMLYYQLLPGIDPYAKRYVKGDLALGNDPIADQMRDSLLTDNPLTAPFYLYLFALQKTPPEGMNAWTEYMNFTSSDSIAAAFILKDPCTFFTKVKNGPYQKAYQTWVASVRYTLRNDFAKYSDLAKTLSARMEPSCGRQYEADLVQFILDLKRG